MKSGSRLERILTSGGFAVTGELGPPKSSDPEVVRQKSRLLKGNVDAVNITDCQTAIVRMSSIAAGLITLSEGVEPVIQMTCRDRNRIGMQSDLLGASALGLKNLLCLTGDHQKFGNHPGAKGVFDMDSIQLLGMVRDMRDNRQFQCGETIKAHEPRMFLGAAANPFAGPDVKSRAARLGKKVANGADFVQTQIIYNVEKFAEFMEEVRNLGLAEKVYVLAGVTPPRSLGMARYMKNFVPGMDVPDSVIDRLKGAKDKEEEGINICVDIIQQVREIKGVSGVHIMAIEWESAVPEIVSRAKLGTRPVFDDDTHTVEAAPTSSEIVVRTVEPGEVGAADQLMAEARREAEKIIDQARAEAATITRSSGIVAPTVAPTVSGYENIETEDAGEDEMNEKERLMALESVRNGLDALKKAFNLTDAQFDALAEFAGAEAILKKQPILGSVPAPKAQAAPVAHTAPVPSASEVKAVDTAKVAEETARKAEAEKAAALAAKKAEAQRIVAAATAKKAEAQKVAKVEAPASAVAKTEASIPSVAKTEAPAPAIAEKKAAVPAAEGKVTASALKVEETTLAQRASKIPADHYKTQYSGKIREVVLGNGEALVKTGGETTLPFQLYEGAMPNRPIIAMDILDVAPDEWPETLSRHFSDVMSDPVAWAKKCVNDFKAEALCLSLVSTDPNGMNRSSAEAAKIAAEVISSVDVPIILWGCGNADKDTNTLREITAMIGDKKVCLAPLGDANYRSIGATAMAFQHQMVAASPIDVNLAKQLNILLENLGVSLDGVLIDPSIGALGYGIEYTYSVMERIRLAAMTQKDEKLQVPFVCNLGREVWKSKETKLPSDGQLGDQERRGVLMEAMTASCMMLAGGEVLIMRHPQAIALIRSLINGLLG
ncbi:MAG: acetyl-CoA decarbonylase/synthase complex subunit delta [Proteobacteria bacterium]|nr:acetyl-CoA decarbonylase/synthase complex subunit delta [Pseudomonadota bacterium]MBU1686596.1 acetyl-CoA decarbonylase/synthase complex subunit delta [Pseudomonadota bacterium]